MTETERLYRNKKTFNYAKKKNCQFYIENNDDDDKEQNFESFKSEKEENQKFLQKENQIVFHRNDSASYSAYYLQTTNIK